MRNYNPYQMVVDYMHTMPQEQEIRNFAAIICSKVFKNNTKRIVKTEEVVATTLNESKTLINEFRIMANKHGHNVPASDIDLFNLVIHPLFLVQLKGGR